MNHIRSLNFGYMSKINKDDKVQYLNALASFVDKQTLICSKNPEFIRKFTKNNEIPKD